MVLSVVDIFPVSGQEGVPLRTYPVVTLLGTDYDEDSLEEGFFIEGPDTDKYIGPGQIDLYFPENISQNDMDDFLESPGYTGLVQGTVTVSGIDGNTVLTFSPTYPLAPLTEYTVNLTSILDGEGEDIDGLLTFSFTTGSGSIIEVPTETSSTILNSVSSESDSSSETTALEVSSTIPTDHKTSVPITTDEIIVIFNKDIVASSLTGRIAIQTIGATDHPNASINSIGVLAFSTEVQGNRLIIKI